MYSIGGRVYRIGRKVYSIGGKVYRIGRKVYSIGGEVYRIGRKVYSIGCRQTGKAAGAMPARYHGLMQPVACDLRNIMQCLRRHVSQSCFTSVNFQKSASECLRHASHPGVRRCLLHHVVARQQLCSTALSISCPCTALPFLHCQPHTVTRTCAGEGPTFRALELPGRAPMA